MQFRHVKRREFITLLGGAVAWPLAARAQQPAMPVIGFLSSASAQAYAPFVSAYRKGLNEAGLFEGRNVAIEFRWAEGQYDRLPSLASELVGLPVSLISASGGLPAIAAAKAATATVPIVFTLGSDPVKFGIVDSLNRPGGNITGVSLLAYLLDAKRVELLHELVPSAAVLAILVNPNSTQAEAQLNDFQAAARSLGVTGMVLRASTENEIDTAYVTLAQQRGGALVVSAPSILSQSARPDRCSGRALQAAFDLRMARDRLCRRSDELRRKPSRRLSPGRCLRGARSERRKAFRSAGPAAYEIRAGHQSENSEGSGLTVSPKLLALPTR